MNNTKRCLSWLSSYMTLFLLASLTLLSGCGGSSSSASKTTTTTPTVTASLEVLGATTGDVGQTVSFLVTGGTPGYSVISTNTSIVTVSSVSQSGSNYIFTATLVGSGSGTLIVSDASQKTVKVSLTSSAVSLKTSAPSSVTIATGATASYTIAGGKASYSASSSNSSVATVSVIGTTLTIKGIASGTATIYVNDASLNSVSISLTVGSGTTPSLYTSAPSSVTMTPKSPVQYSVAGGTAPYSASSSNDAVASVASSGSLIIVTPNVAGSADIVVKDAAGASVSIAVTVANSAGAALYTTAPTGITISAIGGARAFNIGGGTAPYTCNSDNTNVVTVNTDCTAGMTITGVADGKASVLIKDATGSASITITVNVATTTGFTVIGSGTWKVSSSTPCPSTMASPYSVFFINGGTPPYTVASTSPLVGSIVGVNGDANLPPTTAQSVSIASKTVTSSGGYFVVAWPNADNGCADGKVSFKIVDATGLVPASIPSFEVTYTYTAPTATTPSALYTSAPSSVTVAVGASSPSYAIGGGSGSYTAISSNTAVATTSVNGTTLTITGVAAGSASIAVKDSAGTVVTISVTVGSGSSASALYTTAPSAVTIASSTAGNYSIGGGTAPYVAISSNTAKVTTSIVNGTSQLIINGVASGSANVVVTDAVGTQVTIAVTVP